MCLNYVYYGGLVGLAMCVRKNLLPFADRLQTQAVLQKVQLEAASG